MKKRQDQDNNEPKREKYLALKAIKSDSSKYDEDVSYFSQGFIRDMKSNSGFQKRKEKKNTSKPSKESDYCHKCGKTITSSRIV